MVLKMPDNDTSLRSTLEGCRRGDPNCQRKLYEHFYGYAMSICLRYAKNREEAVEVLNDAFFKVFSKIDKYDTGSPFKPWLRRVLIHTAIDYHRSHHKFPGHLELQAAADVADDEPALPVLSPDEDVLPLLRSLSPVYRMVFNLFVMEEYSHQEIAEVLGISVSTSRSNLVRAKENLRAMLTKESLKAV